MRNLPLADRSLFVNMVISDLPRTRAFFEGLGFSFNPQFSNDEAACMVVSDKAFFMMHTPNSMKRFNQDPPADPRTTVTALYAFSVGSREEVAQVADKALATGGSAAGEPQDYGFMCQRSFRDPDGHYWEIVWMDPAHVQ